MTRAQGKHREFSLNQSVATLTFCERKNTFIKLLRIVYEQGRVIMIMIYLF